MSQLVFLSLFLGLTAGVQPVQLAVGGSVAKVELRLDDRVAATIDRAPWSARIDFRDSPAPHRLIAIGLDDGGHEVARAEQKINVSRAPAEAALVIQADRVAFHWMSIDGQQPKSVLVTVDGRTLTLDQKREAALPVLAKDVPHFVQATAVSATGDIVLAHAIYGGASGEDNGALTAVPVSIEKKAPPMNNMFDAKVIAVEKPPAEVILVRDPSEAEAVVRYGRMRGESGEAPGAAVRGISAIGVAAADDATLGKDATIRFLWPFATSVEGAELFPSSHTFDKSRGGFRFLLTSVSAPSSTSKIRFADAVSVAGLQALSKQRRRAVVLIVGRSYHDESRLKPKQAREYLASIGVPLFVWSLADSASLPPGAAAWGDITLIENTAKLRDAVRALGRTLDAQRIVWIDGDFLPNEVRMKTPIAGVKMLAR
jgi:hypothetical protein